MTAHQGSLPPGWVRAKIEDLFAPLSDGRTMHQGWSPQCDDESARPGEWGVLKTTAIQAGAFFDEHNKRLPPALEPRPGTEVRVGDILLTCAGPRSRCGVPCLVRHTRSRLMMSGKMYRFRVPAGVNPTFIEGWLLTAQAQAAIDKMKTGGSDSGLNLTHDRFRMLEVVVAPSKEQDRIVEALETYLPRLDAAKISLDRVQARIKAYRASVLKAAMAGRLVPAEAELARKEKREYEPASALLARILKERRSRWEKAEVARLKKAGKAPKDDRWKAKYVHPGSPDIATLPPLPEGWCWASAAAFYWDAGYGTSEKCSEEADGPPVLRIPNVVDGRISLDDLKFCLRPSALAADGAVAPGDFLFIRTNGSKSLVGKGALVDVECPRPHFFASYLIRLRLVDIESVAAWFSLVWNGPVLRTQLLKVAASSAGQHNVSLSSASEFAVALPPAAEQVRLLLEVARLSGAAEAVDRDITKSAQRVARLRTAVLKWAFLGKLVDQDPADDPAEALLARIRAERASTTPAKSTKGRKERSAR